MRILHLSDDNFRFEREEPVEWIYFRVAEEIMGLSWFKIPHGYFKTNYKRYERGYYIYCLFPFNYVFNTVEWFRQFNLRAARWFRLKGYLYKEQGCVYPRFWLLHLRPKKIISLKIKAYDEAQSKSENGQRNVDTSGEN